MTTLEIENYAPYGMACAGCNDLLIAPNWSAYVSSHEVRHLWSCEGCRREIEMTVNLGFDTVDEWESATKPAMKGISLVK